MTTSFRDGDYAHDLTDEERQTLDALLGRLRKPRRSRYLAPAAAAAAVLGVLSFAVFRQSPSPAPPPPPAASPAAVIGSLAAAAGRGAPATGGYLYRSDVVLVVTGVPAACAVTAVAAQTWTAAGSAAQPAAQPVAGRLVVRLTGAPAGTAAAAGCDAGARATTAPRTLFDGATGDAAARWAQLAPPGHPSYPSPRTVTSTFNLGGRIPASPGKLTMAVDKLCVNASAPDCAGLRWSVLTDILSSPETGPAERALALRTLAGPAGTTVLPAGPDASGRPGVTLRVPYPPGGAELTFDPSTGDLLQRIVRSADGTRAEITLFLAHTRTAAQR